MSHPGLEVEEVVLRGAPRELERDRLGKPVRDELQRRPPLARHGPHLEAELAVDARRTPEREVERRCGEGLARPANPPGDDEIVPRRPETEGVANVGERPEYLLHPQTYQSAGLHPHRALDRTHPELSVTVEGDAQAAVHRLGAVVHQMRGEAVVPSSVKSRARGAYTRRSAQYAALGSPAESMTPQPAPGQRSRRNQTSAPLQVEPARRHSAKVAAIASPRSRRGRARGSAP